MIKVFFNYDEIKESLKNGIPLTDDHIAQYIRGSYRTELIVKDGELVCNVYKTLTESVDGAKGVFKSGTGVICDVSDLPETETLFRRLIYNRVDAFIRFLQDDEPVDW